MNNNYELHVTVDLSGKTIEDFKNVCSDLHVKPIVINVGDELPEQVMTSSTFNKDTKERYVPTVAAYLHECGFQVLRIKIEKFPQIIKDKDHIYYESHIRVKIPKNKEEYTQDIIDRKCKIYNLHKSRNIFKEDKDFKYQMITFRGKNISIWKFGTHIEQVKDSLDYDGISYDKVELEECIYDSNENIDSEWLEKDLN